MWLQETFLKEEKCVWECVRMGQEEKCDGNALWERYSAVQGMLPLIDAPLPRLCSPFTVSGTPQPTSLPSHFVLSWSPLYVYNSVLHPSPPHHHPAPNSAWSLSTVQGCGASVRDGLFKVSFTRGINRILKIEQKMIVSFATKPASSVDCQPTPWTVHNSTCAVFLRKR